MSRRLLWRETASGAAIPSGRVFGFSQALPPEVHGSTDVDWEPEGGSASGSGLQIHVDYFDHPDPWSKREAHPRRGHPGHAVRPARR